MADSYLEARAVPLVELDVNTRENADVVAARALELLNDPEQRDPEIIIETLNYTAERYEEETNDAQGALNIRSIYASYFASTWDEINDIPQDRRGTVYSTAQAMVYDTCVTQAMLEILGPYNIQQGEKLGAINKAAAKRIPDARKREMATEGGIKESIGALSSAKVAEDTDTDTDTDTKGEQDGIK